MKKTTLPKPKEKGFLRSFGYKLTNAESTRQRALRKASNQPGKKNASLKVLQHLNLIKTLNKSAKPAIKSKLKKDVEYMKKYHQKNKKKTN